MRKFRTPFFLMLGVFMAVYICRYFLYRCKTHVNTTLLFFSPSKRFRITSTCDHMDQGFPHSFLRPYRLSGH